MTKEAIKELRYLYNNSKGSDDILIKNRIKEILSSNENLIHVLDRSDLEEDSPEDYFDGDNPSILPFYIINPTQTEVKNFVCYTTQTTEVERYNKRMKYMQIVFTVLCHNKTVIDRDTGIPRHDLLAAILLDQFNWTNYLGGKIHCISNRELTVDTDYAARELIFEMITDANIVKGSIDKDVPYLKLNERTIDKDIRV